MEMWQAMLASAALVGVPLGAMLYAQRRRVRGLRHQLDLAAVDLQRLQESCARLAPGTVVDRMLADGTQATAERKEVTVLFADLVGYTALSERLEPTVLARMLNGYFEHMSDAITRHRGHISTFIGDGILAYFGALEPNPWQCDDAARAALAMRDALEAYNADLRADGLPTLALGVGLHRGPGIAGWVGSRDRMEYAFLGRTVNLASRVESATRQMGADILLTDSVREGLGPQFDLETMPAVEMKGIAQPVVTYALRGAAGPDLRAGRALT